MHVPEALGGPGGADSGALPAWKDRICFSPTGADFQAIVAAILELKGEDATRDWLEGMKDNGTVYDGNDVVLRSVNSGECEVGISYHHYWERDRQENGDLSDNSEQYYFGKQDPGAFVSISGAGILKSSVRRARPAPGHRHRSGRQEGG